MSCFSCGSPDGTIALLCPKCIEERRSAHTTKRSAAQQQMQAVYTSKDVLHHTATSIWVRVIASVVVMIIGAIAFNFYGPVSNKGPLMAMIFSAAFVCVCLAIISYAWLWMKMLVMEPAIGIFALFVPVGVVWYWAAANPEHARSIRVVHYSSFGVGILLTIVLSSLLNVSFITCTKYMVHFAKSPAEIKRLEQEQYNRELRDFNEFSRRYKIQENTLLPY